MPTIPELLRARYPASTHALIFEVRDAAGFSASRSCDAIAIGTWPSRGLKVSGFEFKASRADWLREYREPAKADAFTKFCDEWYLVVTDRKIVQDDELPETWGLLAVVGNALKLIKAAPKLTPQPISRTFLAALAKKAVQQSALQSQIDAAVKAALDSRTQNDKYRMESLQREHEALSKKVADFETESGISISRSWEGGRELGEIVRKVLSQKHTDPDAKVRRLLEQSQALVAQLERMILGDI